MNIEQMELDAIRTSLGSYYQDRTGTASRCVAFVMRELTAWCKVQDFLSTKDAAHTLAWLEACHTIGEAVIAERDALRTALKKYGVHTEDCGYITGWGPNCECDCGFDLLTQVPRPDADKKEKGAS